MKKRIGLTLLLLLTLGLGAQLALSEDDHEDGEHHGWRDAFKPTAGVAAVRNPAYRAECGSCHMAYPPGLLPARSWQGIMQGLSDHFGDNAELDPQTLATLTQYLLENSADQSDYRRSRKIMRSLEQGAAPLRITEIPYIRYKHHELPQAIITSNPKVRSLSNCNACHQQAEQGSFRENDILIPGHGRWDD